MRHDHGELALPAKALLEPVERLVHRMNERANLLRHARLRQAQPGAARTDALGQRRGGDDRFQRAAEDDDVDNQQQQQNGRGDPADSGEELGDDVIDQDIAVGEVLRYLDPQPAAGDPGNRDW